MRKHNCPKCQALKLGIDPAIIGVVVGWKVRGLVTAQEAVQLRSLLEAERKGWR